LSSQEIVQTKKLLVDIEDLRKEMPIDAFLKESEELKEMMTKLERAYNDREKVIDLILKEGTGFESRNALRMFPTDVLQKWAEELKRSR
jgi:hypothetical protein